jgi:lysozyme family protein
MSWTYEATRKGYAKMWDSIVIKAGADTTNAAFFVKKIIAGEKQYRAVEASEGVPWYFVGALHMRESSCDFKGVLHNGEKIIGTGRKTKLVPKGRGPFKTWAAAAIDALRMKASLWTGRTWCPALMGFVSECYNGLGNVSHGVNSAYLWAGSNHEQTGKYVRDHVWDKNFDDPQIGTMTILKALANARPDIAAELAANHVSPMKLGTKIKIGAAGTTVAASGAAATQDSSSTLDQLSPVINVFQNYGTTLGVVFTIAIVVGVVGWHFYEKYQAGPDAEASA